MLSFHQCYNRHDHVVVNKRERECAIVDVAVAGDKGIVEKENEKVKKYQELKQKNSKDAEDENCAGDKDFCRIIRKCDEELGELAGKLDIIISISLPPKNYATRNGKDFNLKVSEF